MTTRQPDYPGRDQQSWTRIDQYFGERLIQGRQDFGWALERSRQLGLPAQEVSLLQAKFLALLVRLSRPLRLLEIGTLGGYSALWMASAMRAEASLVTIERNADFAEVSRENFRVAGLANRIELRVGDAREVLPTLDPAFDFIFVDADKASGPLYLQEAKRLGAPGAVIVFDNVVRGGAVADADSSDASVLGVRRLMEMLAGDSRFDSTVLQTVGEKGWDGFCLSVG